jgi:maltokinase
VHLRLADAFGSAELTVAHAREERRRLRGRLADAAGEAPVLLPYLPALRDAIDELDRPPPGGRVQRVHGDLHLGQVLWTAGRWLLIDFEGEPGAPIEERVAWHSPVQDVAGMLRSLDYAAGHLLLSEPDLAEPAGRWVVTAREEFIRGYARSAGPTLSTHSALLRAYELDKAVYEVVYETRNRLDWLPIPLRAIHRHATG